MALTAIWSAARILNQLLQHQHFNVENREEVQSLFNEITSLPAILENSNNSRKNSEHIASLESQMVDAANKVRDLTETHIGEHIIRRNNLIFSSCELLKEEKREIDAMVRALGVGGTDAGVLERVTNSGGLDVDLSDEYNPLTILSESVGENKTVFVVGTVGIGKTTLARRFFNLAKSIRIPARVDVAESPCYEIRALWVDVSKSCYCDLKQILIDLINSLGNCPEHGEMHEKTTQQLEKYLYGCLEHTKYLIVLDDLHDIQVFDYLTKILPNDGDTERHILVTTRLENLALSAKSSDIHMHHLTIHKQNLYCQCLMRNTRSDAEALPEKVTLLHRFVLENSSAEDTEDRKSLESFFIKTVDRAKGFIKSYFMEYNLTFSPECLAEVEREIGLVKKLITEIDNEEETQNLHRLPSAASSIPTTPVDNIIVEDFTKIKNKLAEESSKLEIVCLVGMGGIGKTTLAKKVYDDKSFTGSFPIRAWVTISQSYDLQKVLQGLLYSMEKDSTVNVDTLSTVGDLFERLYKRLKRWKYLIVIDDVWDTEVWDDLKRIFPDDKCSSRILLTTRLEDVAVHANSCLHRVRFLNEGESWNLFCRKVFAEDSCPPQLEETGKKIVGNCRGLPLSIVVIGGLLSRVDKTLEYWDNVSRNLSSLILSNGNDHCLQILSLSYTHLSDHMKKCFLYFGIFPKDSSIHISELVKLWVAEGFLEPLNSNRLMEDIAYETLLDLVGRSLLLVVEHSHTGKIKRCEIHDLVRDFCIREAKREMFFHITDVTLCGTPLDAKIPLRLCIYPNTRNIFPGDYKRLSSLEVSSLHIFDWMFYDPVYHLNRELLRVLNLGHLHRYFEPDEFLSHNLRYFYFVPSCTSDFTLSFSMPPELQTLILPATEGFTEFQNIWNMAQLRHVKVSRLRLFDLVEGENFVAVLGNLQTLSEVYNFRCSNEVLRRIPNLKKLRIFYELDESDWQQYSLENLSCLQKLEALICTLDEPCASLLHILRFPPSLKKLTLQGCCLPWKEMKIIASLPNLEVLKLRRHSFEGEEWEWESTEGEFPELKYLLFELLDIELWTADTVNFPSLQQLVISCCHNLKEIPRCIGEIPTLELIDVSYSRSLNDSVKQMLEEELESGYDGFQLRIRPLNEDLLGLAELEIGN